MFGIVDWSIVVIYIAAMLWLGHRFSGKQTSTRSYFLGDNTMPWWAAGFSIIATETSALTVIGIPAMAYETNLKFLQIVIGYVIARLFIIVFLIPRYFRGEAMYSPYQIIGENVGTRSKTLSVYFIMIANFLASGVRVYVTAIPLQLLLGIPIWASILIFGVVAIVYTYMGGISAVIWTDVMQFFIFIFGGLTAVFYIPTFLEGGWSAALATAAAEGKLAWFDPAFRLTGDFNIWMGVIGAAVMCTLTHGVDQLGIQRVLTCRNEREGKKAMALSALLIFPVFLVFLMVGVMLFAYYKTHPFAISPVVDGKFKADYLFPIFIISQMPVVLKGFLISSIFAAAMSSVDSALAAITAIYVMNIHKEVHRPGRSEQYYIDYSKKVMIWFGVVLILVAFACQNAPLIMNVAFTLPNLTGGAVLGAMFFAFGCRREEGENQAPLVAGMTASVLVMLYIITMTKIHWPWYSMIGTAVTLLTAIALKRLVPDAPRAVAE